MTGIDVSWPKPESLTDFLLARIGEREALALSAQAEVAVFLNDPQCSVEWWWAVHTKYPSGGSGTSFIRSALPDAPADVLAECAAKRAIVTQWVDAAGAPDWDRDAGWRAAGLEDALKELAAVYADHPDYREEWRPWDTRQG